MEKIITRKGKQYREIGKDEKIGERAFKSFDQGTLRPVCCEDTKKLKPKDFFVVWKFYRELEN